MEWRDIAAVGDIPDGGMKKLDVDEREITLARVGGTFYAFDDRCPHMNAPLHQGRIENGRVICPLHKTQYELATGKRASDPKIPLANVLKSTSMMAGIRVHDLETYEVREENGRILVNLERRKA
jgi:nitrite reductase/ring-hydroxylating ferredoxin subunit